MSTNMPILRRFSMNSAYDADFDWFVDEVRNAVKFDVQVAADIQLDQAQKAPDQLVVIDDQWGQIRSPYPSIWMEWSRGDYSVGCWLRERENSADQAMAFTYLTGDSLAILDFGLGVRIDESGTFGGWRVLGKPLSGSIEQFAQTLMGVSLTALALINCKNVTIPESGKLPLPRSGREKRRGDAAKLVRYRTINLPGGAGRDVTQRRKDSDLTAVHRVRGHFKTFTAERPLMGKFTGTYWWGWQVRGNKANGVVVSDYKVGAL